MWTKLLGALEVGFNCYQYVVNHPIKNTMPIFTEWLIPDALGLHTEVWIAAAHLITGTGFHRQYVLSLEGREKEPINWEHTRIEVAWRVPKGWFVDPWQMEREAGRASDGVLTTWTRWNTEDLKQLDLEAPAYDSRAHEFTLKAVLFLKKHDPTSTQWATAITIPDLMIRYQKPSAGERFAELTFPRPRIRLVSVDPSRRTLHDYPMCMIHGEPVGPPPMSVQSQMTDIKTEIPIGVYSPVVAWATVAAVMACSSFLFLSLL